MSTALIALLHRHAHFTRVIVSHQAQLAYVLEDFTPIFAYVLEDFTFIFAYVLEIIAIFTIGYQPVSK